MPTPGETSDIETGIDYSLGIPEMRIADITRAQLKKLVEVEGTVVGFKAFKGGGGAVKISDGTGRIEISPLFASIFDKIPNSHLLKVNGTRVRARGEVGMFRDNLQIQPGAAENVEVLEKKK